MDGITAIIAVIIVVALLIAFFKLFSKPIKLVAKLLLNTLGGFISLILLNFFGSIFGISLGVNWFNALIVGIFGLPGVAVLLILKWLLLV